MTRKLLTVTVEGTCEKCPHREKQYRIGRPYICLAEEREIGVVLATRDWPIPAWCPLPDAPSVDSTDTRETR